MGGQRGRQRPRLRPVTVDDIVETDVAAVEPDTPVATVVAKMETEDVGSVLVVDDEGKPTGIVTDRAIALSLEENPDISERQVKELVEEDVVTGDADMSVFDALSRLSDESIRRLPIVDDEGTLEGIVTLDDLLVLLTTELNRAGDIIEAQSPRL